METPLWLWIAFNAVVLLLLALDLGVFHRQAHAVSLREAGIWTGVWVALSLAFGGWVWWHGGREPGLQFFTGYVVEYSLSVDNIFVFVLLFRYFAVPALYQHRVLFWGILSALIMRGAFIALGVALIRSFGWVLYLFGVFLVVTGLRMFTHKEMEVHPEQNPVVKLVRHYLPLTASYVGHRLFVRQDHRLMATPLFLVLVVIEITDVIFAVDSIPAVFAITLDPFIVYTSNICAVMGLRSLYFLLAGVMNRFVYLQQGLAVILTYVGVKMLIVHWIKIPTALSLGFIAVVLAVTIALSLRASRRETPSPPQG
ncbi:MAG: TerC family protein [Verrucomicrobia bacterium]|nr:TerC family protein [Verrucomicrobiota bacterium]